ncbi:MAG: diaminopimelate epimerase [Chlorobi bacterium]|nr:diaminopimelate epimerase [Chlorobiota bacterium]
MEISFIKAHGTGNDFIVILDSAEKINLSASQIKELCRWHTGIGADGLIRIIPDEEAEFKMLYYNSDGEEATFCGNGSRVASLLAYKAGWTDSDRFTFIAGDGKHEAYVKPNNIVGVSINVLSEIKEYEDGFWINTGVPHFVIPIKDFDTLKNMDVNQEALKWRHDERFKPEGVNVTFIALKDGRVFVRTFERGVERETLSCGSGAVAAALVSKKIFNLGKPVNIVYPGGELRVYDEETQIILEGPAQEVFKGIVQI